MLCDRIWENARLLTMVGREGDVVEKGVIASRDGRICFVGGTSDVPSSLDAPERIDCEGRWITPGLIDCHTHLVYAGDRSGDFERRLAGASYEELALTGGGILSTVRATRSAGVLELVEKTLPRLDALLREGLTTIEIKSGYGLTLKAEIAQLEAAAALRRLRDVDVQTTFLGAHCVPPEAEGDPERYVNLVLGMIPAIAALGLANAADVFCERIAFTPEQSRRVLNVARAHGLAVKLHADQLSDGGGAALAAGVGALSADHLEYTSESGVVALARAGTVAVLLPGAYYFLREHKQPPVEWLRRHGVRIAVASDSNPGTSPMTSLLLTMNMGATLFGLTIGECLAGVTREAARALGLLSDRGTLEIGKRCDLAIWNIERPAELVYRMGFNPLHGRVWRGH